MRMIWANGHHHPLAHKTITHHPSRSEVGPKRINNKWGKENSGKYIRIKKGKKANKAKKHSKKAETKVTVDKKRLRETNEEIEGKREEGGQRLV